MPTAPPRAITLLQLIALPSAFTSATMAALVVAGPRQAFARLPPHVELALGSCLLLGAVAFALAPLLPRRRRTWHGILALLLLSCANPATGPFVLCVLPFWFEPSTQAHYEDSLL